MILSTAEKLSIAKHGLEAIANLPLDEDWGTTNPAQWAAGCAREHLDIIQLGWEKHWNTDDSSVSR